MGGFKLFPNYSLAVSLRVFLPFYSPIPIESLPSNAKAEAIRCCKNNLQINIKYDKKDYSNKNIDKVILSLIEYIYL